jgi:hypothetical protein
MRSVLKTQQVDGTEPSYIRNAGGRGVGFLIQPAGPNPGYFPLYVQLHGRTDELLVPAAQPFYFDEEFSGFDIRLDTTPNAPITQKDALSFNVVTFERRGDVVVPPGRPTRVFRGFEYFDGATSLYVQDSVPANSPVTDRGFIVLPSWRGFTLNFRETAQDIDVYVYNGVGEWTYSETIPAWTESTHSVYRSVDVGGRRIILVAATPDVTECWVDVELEIG